ncbi:MAG: type IV pilus assembly protein PilM [Candidatus Spechtbacterales bacterium]
MWNPFVSNSQRSLGVDIGTASIKVVELERGEPARLLNYAQFYTETEEGAFHYSSLKMRDSDIVDIIRRMFEGAEIAPGHAAFSLPLFSSFSTLLTLPRMKEEALASAVQFEARKFVPVPMSEVHFDWMVVEHLSNQREIRVLMVAVPNEIIQKYRSMATSLGLTLTALELESFSAARSLVGTDPRSTIILDIGARATNVTIVEKGIVVIHHNSEISGFHFTRTLAQGLALDMRRAGELKVEQGLKPDGQVAELLRPLVDKLVEEMRKLNESYVRQGGTSVQRILVNGGSASMPELVGYLEKSLSIPAELGNPFTAVTVPDVLQNAISVQPTDFSTAIGLALK